MPPLRLVHVVTHPIQYFAPLYRELARRPELDFSVYFTTPNQTEGYIDQGFNRHVRWDVDLLGGYNHFFPPQSAKNKAGSKYGLTPTVSVLQQLIQKDFDVLWVHGYVSTNSWIASVIAHLKKKPVLLRDDQHNTNTTSRWKRQIKKMFLPPLFSMVHPIYVGENNRLFYEFYGVRPGKLFPACHCVDNAFFCERFHALKMNRSALRRRFGITDDSAVILFAGKLIDKKKPDLLLAAFEQLRKRAKCHLLMVGDGALLSTLKQYAEVNRIPDVHWAGFLNQSELPKAYTAADIFVLPSAYEETWGLVVNEAMNFKLPVVVSDKVGCYADLVNSNVNGFVFESGKVDELTAALSKLVDDTTLRGRFGVASGQIISTYTIQNCATQITSAAYAAAKRKLTGTKSLDAQCQSCRSEETVGQ